MATLLIHSSIGSHGRASCRESIVVVEPAEDRERNERAEIHGERPCGEGCRDILRKTLMRASRIEVGLEVVRLEFLIPTHNQGQRQRCLPFRDWPKLKS